MNTSFENSYNEGSSGEIEGATGSGTGTGTGTETGTGIDTGVKGAQGLDSNLSPLSEAKGKGKLSLLGGEGGVVG
jgi:hypothetical protein